MQTSKSDPHGPGSPGFVEFNGDYVMKMNRNFDEETHAAETREYGKLRQVLT